MPDDSVFQTPNLYGPAQMYGMTGRFDYKGLEPQHALAERRLDQRQMIANALMNQSAVPRRGKMAGRLYQPASWTEGAGQLGEALAGVLLAKNIDREREQAQADATARIAAAFQAYNKGTSPTPAFTAETVPGTAVEAVEAQPAVGVPSNLESIIAQGQLPSEPGTVRKSVEDVTNAMAQREQMSPWLRPAAGLPPTRRFAPPPSAPDASLSLDHLFEAAQPGRQPYAPAVETQPAVAGVEGKPDRRATVEEILTRTFSPEFAAHFRQYGYKDMDDKTAAEVAQIVENVKRPNTPEIPRTPSDIMKASADLLASGAPGAWPLIELNMKQREAAQVRMDARAARPVTTVDLGDRTILMQGTNLLAELPKGAVPKGATIKEAGGEILVLDEQGNIVGRHRVTPTEKDRASIQNENIVQRPDGTWGRGPAVGAKEDIARAGSDKGMNADKFLDLLAKRRETLQSAPGLIHNMEIAKTLIPKASSFVGSFGEDKLKIIKFFNDNLGTNVLPEQVNKAEELRSRLFGAVLETLRKLDAQPTQKQQEILNHALGSLATEPAALATVIDVYETALKTSVNRYNADVQSAIDRGVIFPYDTTIRFEPTLQTDKPGTNPRAASPSAQDAPVTQAEIDAVRNKHGLGGK